MQEALFQQYAQLVQQHFGIQLPLEKKALLESRLFKLLNERHGQPGFGDEQEFLDYVLEDVDVVLLMTVNPGFGGQAYIPAMTEKIRQLRRMIDERGLDVKIEIDGGVKLSNAKELIEAGAEYLVAGSSVFNGEPEKAIAGFKDIFAGFEA